MTVSSEQSRVQYATDGVATSFPVPFRFLQNRDLRVTLAQGDGSEQQLSLDVDYSVSGAGQQSGGTLTTATSYAAGQTLLIDRIVSITQETAYQRNDPFPERAHERALDKLTMICQQLASIFGMTSIGGRRVLMVRDSDGGIGFLPLRRQRANHALGFDANGDPVAIPSDLPQLIGAVERAEAAAESAEADATSAELSKEAAAVSAQRSALDADRSEEAAVIAVGANRTLFRATRAALLVAMQGPPAQEPNTPGRVTNDPNPSLNGDYLWNGSELVFLDKQTPDERNVVMVRPSLEDGTDLSTVRKPGDYLLQTAATYLDLPSNFPSGTAILNVRRTAFSVTQSLTPSSPTSATWKRSAFGPPDTSSFGTWLQPGYDFIASIANGNAFSQTIPGGYTLTGNTANLPSGWPEGVDAVLRVKRDGGRTRQEIYPVTDPSLIWRRFSGGVGWRQVAGANLTAPENFARNYAYRRLVAQGNADDLIDEGRYIITQPGTGLPSDAPNQTAFIDVEIYGAFVFQTVRYRNSMRYVWQRSGNISSTGTTWQGYERIGAESGGGGDSPLAGSVIAVIGDSIVESGDWPERMADATGATVHKFGFGGCRMSAYPTSMGRYDGMCGYAIATCIGSGDYTYLLDCAEAVAQPPTSDDNRPQAAALAALDWSTVDILVIAFGTNDWTRPDLDLGTGYMPDPTGMTLRGSVAHIINAIQSAYPNIRIVFQMPTYRTFGGGASADDDAWVPRANNIALPDVNDAIADVAQRAGCPSMDMLRDGTVNAYTAGHYLGDGIHPRPGLGFALWAKRIAGWLRSIA